MDLHFYNPFANKYGNEYNKMSKNGHDIEVTSFEIDGQISMFFTVVGFMIGTVCLVGFLWAFFINSRLLKSYSIIVTIVIIFQATVIGIYFEAPGIYYWQVNNSLENGLRNYNPNHKNSIKSVRLWDFIMAADNHTCCGMDGVADFKRSAYFPMCPSFCCNSNYSCFCEEAFQLIPPVPGCKDKVKEFSQSFKDKVVNICIWFLFVQGTFAMFNFIALTC